MKTFQKKENKILKEARKVEAEIGTPITFMAQSNNYTAGELNAIRFFALHLLQLRLNKELKKELTK